MSFDVESVRRIVEEAIPFVRKVGVHLEDVGPRRAVLRYDADAANANHVGTQHAGALFTFGETCGGAAILASFELGRFRLVAKGARIDYLRPVTGSVRCDVEIPGADVERVEEALARDGRTVYPLAMTFTDEAGDTAFTMTVDYHFRRLALPAPRPG